MKLAAAFSVVLALGAAALAYALGSIGGASALLFTAAVAALPFTTLTSTWGAALRGLGHGVLAQALPTLLRSPDTSLRSCAARWDLPFPCASWSPEVCRASK